MPSRLLLVLFVTLFVSGCNNTLNPFCGSARPVPSIGSLSPSTVTFSQVQQGVVLTVNGSEFVAASEVLINGKSLTATAVSSTQLKVTLTTGVISGPGPVNVSVLTPSGNSSDLGCSSGGKSTTLVLTVK